MNVKPVRILQGLVVIILTAFFFSFLIYKNNSEFSRIAGVYFGKYVWPLGLLLYERYGSRGWALFSFFTSIWYAYAWPLFYVVEGMFKIQIPYTKELSLYAEYTLSTGQWTLLFFCVLVYNIIIAALLPYVLRFVYYVLYSIRYMSFKESTYEGMPKILKVIGEEDEPYDGK